jgi:hypothetical protein
VTSIGGQQRAYSWESPVVITGFGGCLDGVSAPSERVARYLAEASPHQARRGERSAGGRSLGLALARTLTHPNIGQLPGPAQRAIVVGTNVAALEETVRFQEEIETVGPNLANPALFPVTVMNAAAGLAAIDYDCQGPNVTLQGGARCAIDAIAYGADLVASGSTQISFAGGFEGRGLDACRARGRSETPVHLAVVVALTSLNGAREAMARPSAQVLAFCPFEGERSCDRDAALEAALATARSVDGRVADRALGHTLVAERPEDTLTALLDGLLAASMARERTLIPLCVRDEATFSHGVLVLGSCPEWAS